MSKATTVNRYILSENDVRSKVLEAIELVSAPVIQTIGPQGKNVLFEDELGGVTLSNDGVTIIKNLAFKDQLVNSVAEIIKNASQSTNREAGDATSTTVLLTSIISKVALDLKKRGISQRFIQDTLNSVANKMIKRLEKNKLEVSTKEDKFRIATISANNDESIAEKSVEAIEAVGVDGMVFLDVSQDEKTTVEVQSGYRIPKGIILQDLYDNPAIPIITQKNVPIIVFDKQMYYDYDAEHILRTARDLGFTRIAVVAKGFVQDALNTFMANHVQGRMKSILIEVSDDTQMHDLATYINVPVVSEKVGRRVSSISKADFSTVESVFADPTKVLIKNMGDSKELEERIKFLKSELEKDKENKHLLDRLAYLTNGIATIKIGGYTKAETREKMFRYEDATNALRAALRHGYLVGGGLSLFNAYKDSDYKTKLEKDIATAISRASVDRIADNAGFDIDYDKLTDEVGYDALKNEYTNLKKAGILEPYRAVEMSLRNAVSAANILTSIGSFVFFDHDKEDK